MTARWQAHRIRDVLLAVMALSAGAVDAMSWLGLGKVFSGFMTGNLIFIGAGVSSGSGAPAVHALVAVAAFGSGPGPRRGRSRARIRASSGPPG